MTSEATIVSVGIDIGTTTTKVVFSRLALGNTAPAHQVSRYAFVARTILYASPVYLTPVLPDGSIDVARLRDFIGREYERAGFAPAAVETGAVIITGESWKARNAREALLRLSAELGDFVVATAGPHLEGILAGRGSGCAAYSERHFTTAVNVDIGGGTANIAVFRSGAAYDSVCLNVGGRLIQTDTQGAVQRLCEPARMLVRDGLGTVGEPLPPAAALTGGDLQRVAATMAELLAQCLRGGALSALARKLMLTAPLREPLPPDAPIFLSGGVGACFHEPELTGGNPFAFGDIGPLFAAALRIHPWFRAARVLRPAHALRATVIGVGAHALRLSGNTIWMPRQALPLRNVPVLCPRVDWSTTAPDLELPIRASARLADLDLGRDLHALFMPREMPRTYAVIAHVAAALARFCSNLGATPLPLLILCYHDVGKALGMLLAPALAGRALAVIDEVDVKDGDFVDIGQSLLGGELLPLTVKSLAFPAHETTDIAFR
ncbi:MAG: ethanolamine ammonia-lyase reactivating factor EutA [Candidatus Schekmanbacteria bacterium]|nr:ethanolamine ammonia-lyase reactivating factor EutA [Candidatus Schekmanbacteria bacterium]